MAYDERLAERTRQALATQSGSEERHMFGGIAFLVHGHMAVGLVDDLLMVRVGPGDYEKWLETPHVRPMDFTGRPLRGFLYVEPEGVASPKALRKWVDRGVAYAASLPPKPKAGRRRR